MNVRLPVILLCLVASLSVKGVSFELDSIAKWGKFPRFVVNTYRWGAEFFNGFDTTYVQGTGYPFNVKVKSDSWNDYYGMRFENGTEMRLVSDPSTSLGFHLTYLALSVGYDMNVSKYFNGNDRVRNRFRFQFNCMLFSSELYYISNDVGTRIRRFKPDGGDPVRPNLRFAGINNHEWGVNLSYYFNHKRYSAAAAYSFSRVQIRSGGSWYAGFGYNHQKYDFDFNGLPDYMKEALPKEMDGYNYFVDNRNYLLSVGYGYNWVFRPKFILGVSVQPMLGVTRSLISAPHDWKTTVSTFAVNQISVVYNNDRWFAGIIATSKIGLSRNSERMLLSAYLTAEASIGWRFSLW